MILARVVWLDRPFDRSQNLLSLSHALDQGALPRASPNARIILIPRVIAKRRGQCLGTLSIADRLDNFKHSNVYREGGGRDDGTLLHTDVDLFPFSSSTNHSHRSPITSIDQTTLSLLSSLNRRLKPGLDHPPPSSPPSLQFYFSTPPPRHTTSRPSFHRQPWLTTTRTRRGS
jgi:hypothetical protein